MLSSLRSKNDNNRPLFKLLALIYVQKIFNKKTKTSYINVNIYKISDYPRNYYNTTNMNYGKLQVYQDTHIIFQENIPSFDYVRKSKLFDNKFCHVLHSTELDFNQTPRFPETRFMTSLKR